MRNIRVITEQTQLTPTIETSFNHRDTETQRTIGDQFNNKRLTATATLAGRDSKEPLCLCVSVVKGRLLPLLVVLGLLFLAGCARKPDSNTLVMVIESSP